MWEEAFCLYRLAFEAKGEICKKIVIEETFPSTEN